MLGIDTVCDVGSLNGDDALRFRAAVPAAAIHAFEAHPDNALAMQSDPELRRAGIAVVPTAVADRDGQAQLFATTAAHSRGDAWRGMSSLHRRTAKSELLTPVPFPRRGSIAIFATGCRPPRALRSGSTRKARRSR